MDVVDADGNGDDNGEEMSVVDSLKVSDAGEAFAGK